MIVVFDTETTGLTLHPDAPLEKQPRIIEFGGVLLDPSNGQIVEECSIMIDPGEEITPEITKITGITNDDVRGAPKFVDALPQLRRFFAEGTAVMAHNLPFDKAMMRAELMRCDCRDFPWPAVELCTVGLYKEDWGRNPKLTELYEHVMGKKLAQTHRALDDVKALVEIVQSAELHLVVG
jgi:DNA polymerase III epsilon subunit-like protein